MPARRLTTALALTLLVGLLAGPRPAYAGGGAADLQGTKYGEGVTLPTSTAISKILAAPDEYDGKRVRVEGLIVGVCAKRGCWMEIAGDKEFTSIRFKVQDGQIVFPLSARGKYAVAEGTVKKIVLSLEQTRRYLAHKAKEEGKEFDPASVTEPLTFVMLKGIGAVVRDAR